jgi:DNA invertase Pin-like site-specific DNA recombinase
MDKECQASPTKSLRAVMYVRSATYDEKIFEEQIAQMQAYADRNGMQVVRGYVEGGFSGLKQGPKQKEMLNAVQAGTADFSVILMRDISRWGRFQDADESAYYEFLCRRAGIDIRYTQEEKNAGTGFSGNKIIENLRRAAHVDKR